MSERIVIDVDRDGWTRGLQLQIAQHYKNGGGEGYRLAGPKYNGSSKNLLRCELDERDAREIRTLLNAVFPVEQLASRAEVLREAADALKAEFQNPEQQPGLLAHVEILRRMADEAGQEKATPTGEATPANITIYRASHDSIVMDFYTSREAARDHCQKFMEREQPNAELHWYPDTTDGDNEEAPEDLFMVVAGEESDTGYAVTPLPVASAYDPEADE